MKRASVIAVGSLALLAISVPVQAVGRAALLIITAIRGEAGQFLAFLNSSALQTIFRKYHYPGTLEEAARPDRGQKTGRRSMSDTGGMDRQVMRESTQARSKGLPTSPFLPSVGRLRDIDNAM